VFALRVAVISSEDPDVRASCRMILNMIGVPWEEAREIDPTEHMIAIVPEGAEPTPPVVPSIIVGSSLRRYSPESRYISEEAEIELAGVKAPVYNLHSAPGERFEGLPASFHEGNILIWFDLFRGAFRPVKEGSANLMPLIYLYSRVLLKLMIYLCRRERLPLVRKMRWPSGMQCCIPLGMEVREIGEVKHLLERRQLSGRVTMLISREACEKASSRDLERISSSPLNIGIMLEDLEGVERLYDRISYLRGGKVGIRVSRHLGSFSRVRESLLSLKPLYTSILTIDGNISSMGSPGPVAEQPREIPVSLREGDRQADLTRSCSMERCFPVIVRSRDFLMSFLSSNCWVSDLEGLLSWSEERDSSSVEIRYSGRELEIESISRVKNLVLEITSSRELFPREKVVLEGGSGRYMVRVPSGRCRMSFSLR